MPEGEQEVPAQNPTVSWTAIRMTVSAVVALIALPWCIYVHQATSLVHESGDAIKEIPAFMERADAFMKSGSRYTSERAEVDQLKARADVLNLLIQERTFVDGKLDELNRAAKEFERELNQVKLRIEREHGGQSNRNKPNIDGGT